MGTPFVTTRRVEFHETDTAGIVHFSNFFRYMEMAEVEFLRSLGLHVSWREGPLRFGFPRVSASCDYLKPARFGDLMDVTVTVEQVGAKSVTYAHEFRLDGQIIARGKITAVYVRVGPEEKLQSAEIPTEIRAKILGQTPEEQAGAEVAASAAPARTPLPLVTLDATGGGAVAGMTAKIQMSLGDQPVQMEVTVPVAPVPLREVLPVFQGFTDLVMDIAVRRVEEEGKAISCQKGCGACCRQLVPIAESEARALAGLVEALPQPRRSHVRDRFADAHRRLEAAGLLDQLRLPETRPGGGWRAMGRAYFELGIACPFLEEESCSIHPDRPLACREYLVTTPAANCAAPSADTVHCVPLPAHVAGAVRAVDKSASPAGWVPLALALDWAAAHPEEPAVRPGPDWVKDVFARLKG